MQIAYGTKSHALTGAATGKRINLGYIGVSKYF